MLASIVNISPDMVNIVNKIQVSVASFFLANNEKLVNTFQPITRGGIKM